MKEIALIPFGKPQEAQSFSLAAYLVLKEQKAEVHYRVEGPISELELNPKPVREELWKHTCFELFLKGKGNTYFEWNFSPVNLSNAYAFTNYREGQTSRGVEHSIVNFTTKKTAHSFELKANLLLPTTVKIPLEGSFTAVLELNKALTYWAKLHTREKPDFHAPDSFYTL